MKWFFHAVCWLFVSSTPLFAQPALEYGDVVMSGGELCSCGFTFPRIDVYDAVGRGKYSQYHVGGRDLLVAPNGILYVITLFGQEVVVLSSSLTELRRLDAGLFAQALAMDKAENVYVIAADGTVRRFTGNGDVLSTHRLPTAGEAVIAADLGLDQCTMYYFARSANENRINENRIGRYDLCRNETQPDLASGLRYSGSGFSGWEAASVRVAKDGSVFFAGGDKIIHRFLNGVDHAYDLGGTRFSRAVVPTTGPRFVWTAGNSLGLFDLEGGRFIVESSSSSLSMPLLAIYGVSRASVLAGPESIPALSSTTLLILGITICAIGVIAIRG